MRATRSSTSRRRSSPIDTELDKLRRDGPEAKELERALNTIETAMIQSVEKTGRLADRMQRYNHYLGDPGYLGKDLQRYGSITAEAVRKIADAQLRKDARVVIYAVPGKQDLGPEVPTPEAVKSAPGAGSESVNADEAWRGAMPKPGRMPKLALPVPKSFKLANGLTVIHHKVAGLPIVSANLVVRSGSGANPLAIPGLASFTAEMLDEGTATRSATQLADDVAQLGTTLVTASAPDSSNVSLSVLKKNFAAALDIMADVTLHPAFAQEEIERRKSSRLASLVQVREDPSRLVSRITVASLFGEKHPFGYLEIGTEDAVKVTTRDDLMAFWKGHYVPGNAALVVAGDIDADELKALAEKSFGAWKAGPVAATAPAQPAPTSARLVIVDKPAAPQTATRVAMLGPPRRTPDYPALSVMNAALGGLFSRRGMREKQVGAEELARARDSQVRSLPGEFETGSATAQAFAGAWLYDLGLDYYAKLPARLGTVTAQDMQLAARKYVAPERLVVVVVGDQAKIEPELAKLKLGKVEHRDADARVK